MRTVEIKLYNINELEATGNKQKAIELLRDINVDHQWWDFQYDNWIEEYAEHGINIDKDEMFFGLSYSQGDGLSFLATFDVEKFSRYIDSKWNTDYGKYVRAVHDSEEAVIELEMHRLSSQYYHEETVYFELGVSMDTHPATDYFLKQFEDQAKIELKELMRKMFNELQESYEYLTSDDSVVETAMANDYEFTADGEIFTGIR